MSYPNLANGWTSTLSGAIDTDDTTVDVAATAGMPSRPFQAVILAEGANSDEIVTVTNLSSSTITITRATEPNAAGSSSASSHASGATISHVLTAGALRHFVPLPIDHAAAVDIGSGDHFNGTSLDGGWSDLQSNHTTQDRTVDGYLKMTHSGNTGGQERGIVRSFSPSGDFTVWTRIENYVHQDTYQWAGVFVGAADASDGASGHRIQTHVYSGSNTPYKFAKMDSTSETVVFGIDVSTYGSGFQQNSYNWKTPMWLRIRRSGTTLYSAVSFDGAYWIEAGTTTTISFTVATIGLYIGSASSAADIWAVFDYIATTG